MALATPALGGATARDVVAARLTQGDRDVAGWVMLVTLLVTVGFTLLVLFTLLFEVTSEAWPMMSERPVEFVTDTIGSDPATSGLWPGIYGSFFIGLGVVALAFPIGIGAAIYLEEYARDGFLTRLIMVSMRNLAGVPAVIYGVLGFIIFRSWLEFLTGGSSVVAAAFTMAILVMPIVIITSMEAIRAVPQGLRDAGYGVGASRWEVTRDHTLPYAAPGILTGTMLSLARALGEAAPLLILGAITGSAARDVADGQLHGDSDAHLQLVRATRHTGRRDRLDRRCRGGRRDAADAGPVLQRRGDRAAEPIRAPPDRDMSGRLR